MIVATDKWWNYPSEETYKDFVITMQSEGLLVLDVESLLGFDSEEMLIPDDGHWNQSGNVFVAEQLKDFIERNRLMDPPLSR